MGRTLFNARDLGYQGYHFWEHLIKKVDLASSIERYSGIHTHHYHGYLASFSVPNQFENGSGLGWLCVIMHLKATMCHVSPAVHVWRIQRMVRRFLQRRYEERVTAMLMGSNARLGKNSCLDGLPSEIFQSIAIHM